MAIDSLLDLLGYNLYGIIEQSDVSIILLVSEQRVSSPSLSSSSPALIGVLLQPKQKGWKPEVIPARSDLVDSPKLQHIGHPITLIGWDSPEAEEGQEVPLDESVKSILFYTPFHIIELSLHGKVEICMKRRKAMDFLPDSF